MVGRIDPRDLGVVQQNIDPRLFEAQSLSIDPRDAVPLSGIPDFPQTVPANTVLGRTGIDAGPVQAVPFALLEELLTVGTGIINVKDFGAKGDGVTNDTLSIQAAIDALFAIASGNAFGGTLFFPSGNYLCGNLRVYRLDHQQVCFRIMGASCHSTQLTYTGTGNFLQFGFAFQFEFSNFEINNNGARGTTVGLQFGFPGGSGSTMGGGIVQLVTINNFHVGMDTGGADASQSTSSEINYRNVIVSNCDVGVYVHDANGLDHNFFDFLSATNGKGIRVTAGSDINVYGGSSSGDTTVMSLEGCAGNYSIQNFRSETTTTSFVAAFNFAGEQFVNITNCEIHGDGAGVNLLSFDGAIRANVTNCYVGQKIRAGEGGQKIDLNIQGCGIGDSVAFNVFDLGGGTFSYRVIGSYLTIGGDSNALATRIVDQFGRVDTSVGTILPSLQVIFDGIATAVTTVSGLASVGTSQGGRAMVTDATVAASGNFGAIVAGGGANVVPVWCDATNWRIG